MILLTPKARKTSCSGVCKSAPAGHRRNSGERSKATELGLFGGPAAPQGDFFYGVSVSLEAALSCRWQRAASALAGIARGEGTVREKLKRLTETGEGVAQAALGQAAREAQGRLRFPRASVKSPYRYLRAMFSAETGSFGFVLFQ